MCDSVALRSELMAHARGILGRDGARAEDVVQEAYVHLLQRARDGEAPHSPRPWLHSVVSSLCLRELSRRRRHQPTEIESLAAPGADPAELAEIAAEVRWALAGVAALPGRERATMIAELADMAQGREGANARYQALHRARHKLRELRREAWALIPLPLVRWGRLSGSAHAGAGAGSAAPTSAIATWGVVKGALVVAVTALALGSVHMVGSAPGPSRSPAREHAATTADAPGAVPSAPASAPIPVPARAPTAAAGRGSHARAVAARHTPSGSAEAIPRAARALAVSPVAAPSPYAGTPAAAPASAPPWTGPAPRAQTGPPVAPDAPEDPGKADGAGASPDIQAPDRTDAPDPVAQPAQDAQVPDGMPDD